MAGGLAGTPAWGCQVWGAGFHLRDAASTADLILTASQRLDDWGEGHDDVMDDGRDPLHCGESSVTAASSCCLLPRQAQARVWGPRALGKDNAGAKTRGLRSQTGLVPPFLHCVTLGKSLNLSEPPYCPDTSYCPRGVVETIEQENANPVDAPL